MVSAEPEQAAAVAQTLAILARIRESVRVVDAKTLDEAGYQAPANAGLHDILDMMDRVEQISDYVAQLMRSLGLAIKAALVPTTFRVWPAADTSF